MCCVLLLYLSFSVKLEMILSSSSCACVMWVIVQNITILFHLLKCKPDAFWYQLKAEMTIIRSRSIYKLRVKIGHRGMSLKVVNHHLCAKDKRWQSVKKSDSVNIVNFHPVTIMAIKYCGLYFYILCPEFFLLSSVSVFRSNKSDTRWQMRSKHFIFIFNTNKLDFSLRPAISANFGRGTKEENPFFKFSPSRSSVSKKQKVRKRCSWKTHKKSKATRFAF